MGGCSSAPEDEESPETNRRIGRKTSETNSVDLIARKVEIYLDLLVVEKIVRSTSYKYKDEFV